MMDSNLGIGKEVIKDALSVSMEAREKPETLNIRSSPSQMILAFPESWSPEDWFPEDSKTKPFGETEIDREKFPSLRSIGRDVAAKVSGAFMARFVQILEESGQTLRQEVAKALDGKKQIIFTGHSSGGPIAIYATVWFLEEHKRSRKNETPRVFCLTYASPLTTDGTFCHAIQREGWSEYFLHFVTKLDIIPRILLAPPSSTRELLIDIASFSNPHHKPVSTDNVTSSFVNVMKNVSCVANHAACALTGSKQTLFETMCRFIKLSPYRPCGKYVFCTETGASVVVKNPDAVLQLLFYSLKIQSEKELQKMAVASLTAHWTYEDALDGSLDTLIVFSTKTLQHLALSSDNVALNDLNLCPSARLCLRAAGELEKRKVDNQIKIEDKKGTIEGALKALEKYRTVSKDDHVGYYDAFKSHKREEDFKANVNRLELAAIWEEIIEMLRQGELPDGFEAEKEWVDLGMRFRRLVEPIDIANYYRHSRDEVAGPYMDKGRPSGYKYTQRWQEHAEQLPNGSCGESYFWAEVEDLNRAFANKQPPQKALELAKKLKEWHSKGEVKEDAFLKETTLVKWWKSLPDNYEAKSCIDGLIES